ncbi:uncharacterized protein F5891DRAFT_1131426 [Suillus fuscotomentosus]|uniref:CxC2-like cysteine cluster KDZ transposase-associated domain-containing protein n=1 Tax=Suillus fuscotomentosus TaxID=1912939 RepID=A0AAD4DTL5_9AGAM|nr:uncharacterized protein F5891DRAFT_1131426 [Suillus fuscotomentosus]KAG1892924.1 hypothetical protein F5891DRAFT_1131426 [Suillus fuscotomentosus]
MPNSPPESPTIQPVEAPPPWEDFPDNTYEQDQGSFEPLQLPKTMASSSFKIQSQNDYLRQWLPRQESYLHHFLYREAPPEDRRCIICQQDGVYKCQDCLGEPLYCTDCCRSQHRSNPFHWISQWNGRFFERSCLAHVGLIIYLGHDGKQCPAVTDQWNLFEEDEPEDLLEPEDLPFVSGPEFQPKENTMVIVDKSGVHHLEVRCCECQNAMSPDIQMFRHGFFPASFNRPKTVFTFRVLNDFLLDSLECGTLAMNYYNKLRRMTSSMFPHLVPDRYRELMRVARQWRHIGELALFCPACPQPGINVLLSEDESLDDDPSWKYTQSFVMDGNFKAEHLHPIKPFDEVWLSDRLGFMVGKDRYKMHLAEAADTVEKSSCNNHRAVNQANAARHKLESTGIRGVACARHGCLVPHSMVDFQKGERQMNMDYALCEASRHNMEGITRAVTFYDINCQYNKHFQVWVDRSRFLEMAPQLTIIPGIGLWHVHGHQDSYYVRYASNFIEGIGRIDGEIMEMLWARLNLISPAARGMSSPHRKECLDYQMNDSNFCKMIRMKRTLCRKYKLARNGISESGKAFDRLDEAAPSHLKTEWLARERIAQSTMDEYEINIKRVPRSKNEIELRLLEEGNARNAAPSHRSVATWISTGLAIEEAQIALLIEVRRIGRRSTETQRLDIARQRDRLQGQIDGFARSALTHLGEGFDADDEPEDLDVDILDDLDDDPAYFTETSHTWTNSPELTVIPLPSNLGDLIPLEMSLHEGQANDALHNLRICLCNKAILFRTTVRQAKSQALKTRAWSQVITAVGDPNARGQRNESLAWFSSVEVDLGGPDQSWNEEFYRVHWLRAKALRD